MKVKFIFLKFPEVALNFDAQWNQQERIVPKKIHELVNAEDASTSRWARFWIPVLLVILVATLPLAVTARESNWQQPERDVRSLIYSAAVLVIEIWLSLLACRISRGSLFMRLLGMVGAAVGAVCVLLWLQRWQEVTGVF